MLRIRLMPLMVLVTVACSSGDGSKFGAGGGDKDQSASKDEAGGKLVVEHKAEEGTANATASNEEEANVPLIVSGAYLVCVDAAGSGSGDLAVGCDLTDKKDNKPIALKSIAKVGEVVSWKATLPADAKGVTVTIKENADPKDGEPQALLLFAGGTAADRRAVADESVARLDLKPKVDLKDVDFFAAKVKDAKPGAENKTITKDAVATTPVTPTDNPSLDPAADQDKDAVLNGDDKCDNTPPGAVVWTADKVAKLGDASMNKWIGCSGGEYGDIDDADHDKVPDIFDKCPTTPLGETVVTTEGDGRRGCAVEESPR